MTDRDHSVSYIEMADVAVTAARAAGDWLLERFGSKLPSAIKGEDSIVTRLDAEAERIIAAAIHAHYPKHSLIGEELSPNEALGALTWAIDPIDGTRNFAAGIPLWAVSIAALERGTPVAAAAYIPVTGEMYRAAKSEGAWLGGERIHIGSTPSISAAVAMTDLHAGFSDSLPESALLKLMHAARRTRMLGSVCCSMCYVTAGRFDIYYAPRVSLWDVAAGVLLVQEAGGDVRSLEGQGWTPDSDSIVAASAPLMQSFLSQLQSSQRTS